MTTPNGRINLAILLLLLLVQALSPIRSAEILEGRVVFVQDGDSVTLLARNSVPIKIRLAQIDAPEIDQPFGQESRQSLSEMVLNKTVVVAAETVDDHGRTVGTLFVDKLDVCREQVRLGMAWAYRQYLHDKSLLQVEMKARIAGVGVWSDAQPSPPWQYRHHGGQGQSAQPPPGAESKGQFAPASCGDKRSCKDMSSCDEARFYLNQCGLTGLDRDHDGVPCESLCNPKK